ncbi:MAG: YihY/virulence factor BrkB family protein [Mobilicoccus sp.]|nr:YihY/virulence factor BrkB family protein [Mobilicoccus sp.]
MIGRIDRWQRRHPVLGVPLAVIYKFLDDQGFYLSALLAFYGFLSLFPLFLLFSTILGFALDNDPSLREEILASAARQIPVIGQQIETQELTGSGTALWVAVVTAIIGSLGVAQALQNAMNVTWGVRRNERPNPVTSRLRSIGLLALLGMFVIATTLVTQVVTRVTGVFTTSGGLSGIVLIAGSMLLIGLFFIGMCRLGTAGPPRVRALVPGALVCAVLWQALQLGGTAFVTGVVARASVTNGVFAIVLGLITWLYFAGIAVVLCLETNAVLAGGLYPRSLLTPMTDLVDLTEADRAAYARLARVQSLKGFQHVDVSFDYDGQYASARRRQREAASADAASGEPGVDDTPR